MAEPAAKASMDAQEECPRELDPSNSGNFLIVEKNKLSIRYTGSGAHNNDVGSIQANCPAPRRRRMYYFELTVRNAGDRGCIAIGFAPPDFKTGRQPGWEPGSYGYHGDDGHKYASTGHGEDYGPQFGTGDVIGAGLHLEAQELFFTKNGIHLGVAFRNVVAGALIPTIGLHSLNEAVDVNFGARAFMYDIDAHVRQEQAAQTAAIAALPVPAGVTHQLVRAYLQHFAYAGTLQAFDAAAGLLLPGDAPPADSPASPELQLRHELRLAINRGDIDAAQQLLRASRFSHLLQPAAPPPADGSVESADGGKEGAVGSCAGGGSSTADAAADVHLAMSCQKFVELLRHDKVDEAVAFAQKVMAPLLRVSPAFAEEVSSVFALIAYQDPAASELKHLLSPAAREATADVVNAAILAEAMPSSANGAADMDTSTSGSPEAITAAASPSRPAARRVGPPPPPPPSAGVANGSTDGGRGFGGGRVRQTARRGGPGGPGGRGRNAAGRGRAAGPVSDGVGADGAGVGTLAQEFGAVFQSAQALVGIGGMDEIMAEELEQQIASLEMPPLPPARDSEAGDDGTDAGPSPGTSRQQQQQPAPPQQQPAPPRRPTATLQRLLAQLAVVRAQMHQANGDQGEVFRLSNDVMAPAAEKSKTA